MEKSFLEKRIAEKAEKRFNLLFNEVFLQVKKNEILELLKIYTDKEKNHFVRLAGIGGSCPSTDLFNYNDLLEKYTNFKEVKDKLIEKFIGEETDIIMSKLSEIEYFFNKE